MSLQTNTVPGTERLVPGGTRGGALYPPGATNANWFGLFNTLSWAIMLGTPAILYVKSLDAGATVLGIVAALAPLMVIFQIPAAHWIPRYGYRRFSLAGWGSRSVMAGGLAVVPLLGFLPTPARIGLVLALLAGFSFLRGVTSGAWLPWITELIPSEVRGRFLSRDQNFAQLGILAAMLLSAACLAGDPAPWQYSLAFLISAVAALVSLWFLARIPDTTAPEALARSGHPVPWKTLLFYPPFFRLVAFNSLWMLAVSGTGVFAAAFLRGVAQYSDSLILLLSALTVAGALGSLWWVGRLLDRVGSLPALRLSIAAFAAVIGGWWVLANGFAGRGPVLVGGLYFLWGAAGATFVVANARLVMGTMPLMGRNHFFALHAVLTNAAAGVGPILWGILLDSIGHATAERTEGPWTRYAIYFALVIVGLIATLLYSWRVTEPATNDVVPTSKSLADVV